MYYYFRVTQKRRQKHKKQTNNNKIELPPAGFYFYCCPAVEKCASRSPVSQNTFTALSHSGFCGLHMPPLHLPKMSGQSGSIPFETDAPRASPQIGFQSFLFWHPSSRVLPPCRWGRCIFVCTPPLS